MMRRGSFILLEGVDRSGKTTQCKNLVDYLINKGIKSKLYGFPNRTTVIGQQINQYLQNRAEVEDHCIHLLFSANRWEARSNMISDLENGYTIICDRYFASGIAFSAAKGIDIDWCLAPDRGLPSPDLVLYLNLDTEEQQRRDGFGGERYEVSSFQRTVQDKFKIIPQILPSVNWVIVNANGTMNDVLESLKEKVDNAIEDYAYLPISVIYIVC